MNLPTVEVDTLWIGALLAIPVAGVVALLCRMGVRSPATRHALWLVALLAFVAPSIVSLTGAPAWVARLHERVLPAVTADPIALDETVDADAIEIERFWDARVEPAPIRATPLGVEPIPAELEFATVSDPRPLETFIPASVQAHEPIAAEFSSRPAPHDRVAPPQPSPAETPLPVVPPAPSETGPRLLERAGAQLAAWGAWARGVAASLESIPPVSGALWLLGALCALTLVAARIAKDRSALRHAAPPGPADLALLRHAADQIALRHPPELRFVEERVSPMVTCGPRRRLIVPRSLWDDLDDDARLSVLLHELAHIRRRDHWTHWLAALVGLVYWWHPLAWVVRSRLADEADLACDAWVTSLMPAGRRVYATALLRTTSFVNGPSARRPLAGASLAMAASSKRRLSRRLTMVMTHKVRPRLSGPGTSIVGVLAVLALIILPGVACPPEEKESEAEIHDHDGYDLHDGDDSTFDEHMRRHEDEADVEGVLHLMDRLRGLEERFADLHGQLAGRYHGAHSGPTPLATPRFDLVVPDAPALLDGDGKVALAYVLPEGRLRALSQLMARPDVPVLVTPEDDRLVVHATRSEHAAIGRFAVLICPEGVTVVELDSGRVRQISRDSEIAYAYAPRPGASPMPVAPGVAAVFAADPDDDECETECAADCQGDCGEGCEGCAGCAGAHAGAAAPRADAPAPDRRSAERHAAVEVMRARLRELRQSQGRLLDTARVSASQSRVHESRASQLERQAERLREQAEREAERADEAESAADELADEASARVEEGDMDRAQAMLARADAMRRDADLRRHRADEILAQSDTLETQAHEAESEAERIEDRVSDLESALEDLAEQIEALEEELEDLAKGLGRGAGAR